MNQRQLSPARKDAANVACETAPSVVSVLSLKKGNRDYFRRLCTKQNHKTIEEKGPCSGPENLFYES